MLIVKSSWWNTLFAIFFKQIIQVFSFDICSFIIEVLLTQSEQLSYVKINYHQDTLLDDYFTREYISTKRRQVFPLNIINQQMMNVKNNGQTIEIWLS
ncbi:unnamed protein product [Adineta steineri]|uniref:Uncharacterized protein n=1 Tax=Adineta steineri TaxID=433720 RepID=A0A818H8N1_9BILA|nr:unnamed protein product [Adineta steineri]CAF3504395.1 unnamed protein product [Adineta steineri]